MSERDRKRRQRTREPKPEGDEKREQLPKPQEAAQRSEVPPSPERPAGRPLQRELKPPKRVRFGLKLKSADDLVGRNDVARRWLTTLNAMLDADGKQEGYEYARLGQTVSIDIQPGVLNAQVQGRRGRPYAVRMSFATLDESQWSRLIDALAGEAAHVAKVLAGELPEQFVSMLETSGLRRDQTTDDGEGVSETILGRPEATCECGYHRPCKHAAAVGYLLVERLNDEPLTALTLLGMTAEQVKEQLRQMRVMKTQGVASAHPDQLAAFAHEPPLPLEACVDEFWRYGPQLADLEHSPLPHHVPHALLRRLGPSPLNGRFPMVGLLASVYDTVTKAAIDLRDAAERSESDAPIGRSDDE